MSTTQDHQMAAVLIRLEMVSHGSTQAWNANGGHSGEPDDKMVSMVIRSEDPLHLVWRKRYEQQFSDAGRERIIESARAEVDGWIKQEPATASISEVDLILGDGEGLDAEVIASRRGVQPSYVRRLRLKNDRDPEKGRKREDNNRVDWAHRLSAEGLSQEQIGQRMGISQPTVHRLLKTRRLHHRAA